MDCNALPCRYLARAVYRWDEDSHLYIPTTIQPTPRLRPHYDAEPGVAISAALETLQKREFQEALNILEQGLSNAQLDTDTRSTLLYLQALALEALNRPDEALAQYIAINEADPNAAWGILARFHVDDDGT